MTLFFALFLKNRFEIDFTSATDKIHFMRSDKASLLVDLPKDVACDDDGEGKVCLEEGIGIRFATNGEQSHVELSDKTDDVEEKTDPRTPDSESSFEWKFVQRVSLYAPGFAKADMSGADRAPGNQIPWLPWGITK